MADTNRINDGLLAPDSNTRRFHAGAEPQAGLPSDLNKEEQATLDVHKAQIKAPRLRGRARQDVPRQGLVMDSETGELNPLKVDKRGKLVPPTKAEQRASEQGSRAEAKAEAEGKPPGGPAGDRK
jgi:hypothetical protein